MSGQQACPHCDALIYNRHQFLYEGGELLLFGQRVEVLLLRYMHLVGAFEVIGYFIAKVHLVFLQQSKSVTTLGGAPEGFDIISAEALGEP